MVFVECATPKVIKVRKGTELNFGPSEDSDSFILPRDAVLRPVGPLKDGAIPVLAIGIKYLEDLLIFWHQPEKPSNS